MSLNYQLRFNILHSSVEGILCLLDLAAAKGPVHAGERLPLRIAVVPRGVLDGALDHVEPVVRGAPVAVEAVAAATLTDARRFKDGFSYFVKCEIEICKKMFWRATWQYPVPVS